MTSFPVKAAEFTAAASSLPKGHGGHWEDTEKTQIRTEDPRKLNQRKTWFPLLEGDLKRRCKDRFKQDSSTDAGSRGLWFIVGQIFAWVSVSPP